jgi:hypothetical protein
MFNFTVQLLQNDKLVDVNFADYIKDKKILICPNINFHSQPSFEYFKYIDSLIDTHGLDEVLIVNSTKDLFFHKLVESMFPRFTSVGNSSQEYIRALIKIRNNPTPVNKLIKHWTYQHLLQNGKSIGFWEQPLSNRWEHLMKNKDALQKIAKRGLWNLKILKKMYKNQQHTANIWELAVKGFISSTVDGYGLLYNMGPEFFHFGLYQNKELDKALRNINTA